MVEGFLDPYLGADHSYEFDYEFPEEIMDEAMNRFIKQSF